MITRSPFVWYLLMTASGAALGTLFFQVELHPLALAGVLPLVALACWLFARRRHAASVSGTYGTAQSANREERRRFERPKSHRPWQRNRTR